MLFRSKTHFYLVSHIFLGSKQILLQRIKIYKQHKKQKSKQKNQNHKTNHERGTKRDRFVGVTRWWTRWVDRFVVSWGDLAVGQGGLIGGWVRGAISPMLGCDLSVLGCAIGALSSAWMCDWRGVHVREDGEYCRTM